MFTRKLCIHHFRNFTFLEANILDENIFLIVKIESKSSELVNESINVVNGVALTSFNLTVVL
jgi:hypothetical protein